jgi:hypothetical protein
MCSLHCPDLGLKILFSLFSKVSLSLFIGVPIVSGAVFSSSWFSSIPVDAMVDGIVAN